MQNTAAKTTAATERRRRNAADRRIGRALSEIIDQGCTLVVGTDGWISVTKDDRVVYRTESLTTVLVDANRP